MHPLQKRLKIPLSTNSLTPSRQTDHANPQRPQENRPDSKTTPAHTHRQELGLDLLDRHRSNKPSTRYPTPSAEKFFLSPEPWPKPAWSFGPNEFTPDHTAFLKTLWQLKVKQKTINSRLSALAGSAASTTDSWSPDHAKQPQTPEQQQTAQVAGLRPPGKSPERLLRNPPSTRELPAHLRADPLRRRLQPQAGEHPAQTHRACPANWADNGISRRTIDNRLSTLRWFAAEIGKPNIVKRTNDEYKHASTQGKTQLHRQGPQSRQGIPGQGPRPPDACEPHPPTRVRPAAERGHHDPTTRSRPRQPHPPARQLGERRQAPRRTPDHPRTTTGPGRSKSPRSARQSVDTKTRIFTSNATSTRHKAAAPGSQICTACATLMPSDVTEPSPDNSIPKEKAGTVPQEADYPKTTFPKKTTRSTSRRA